MSAWGFDRALFHGRLDFRDVQSYRLGLRVLQLQNENKLVSQGVLIALSHQLDAGFEKIVRVDEVESVAPTPLVEDLVGGLRARRLLD